MVLYNASGRTLSVECFDIEPALDGLRLRVVVDHRHQLNPASISGSETDTVKPSWSVRLPTNLYDGKPHRLLLEICRGDLVVERTALSFAAPSSVADESPRQAHDQQDESTGDPAMLAEQARTAQRRGDHALSISLWDRLCGLCPDRPEYLLALTQNLEVAGRTKEADAVLGRAVNLHSDSFWLLFRWTVLALSEGRLDAAEQRARRLIDRFSDKKSSFELLGDIAVRRRDMRAAENHFEAALALQPGDEACRRKLSRARLYSALSQRFPATAVRLGKVRQADYAVLVINLDHNPERFAATEQAFSGSPALLYRIPGVRGSYLPAASCRRLTGTGEIKKGTLGTFLAHVAAWEAVLELNYQYCLIVEDDAIPVIDLPARISALGIPDGFDLCFVNDRMQCRVESYSELPCEFQTRAPIDALMDWPSAKNAPGADAYFLGRSGACKLLEFVAHDGFAGDVDWRLVCHSLPQGGYARLPHDSTAFHVLRAMDQRFPGRITAYTLLPCLISASTHDSVRLIEDAAATKSMRDTT